ncbi:MAG: NifB/NifX family molybdenum-iron cluster-binding protein [Lachnospiraceae bacterium]|nr:NifB/NifX family molybdenum-iron cluster-binding protein [Lachnospiraceae bacterium]
MKIAVTYDKDNTVWQHFGKTTEFKVYEVENNEIVSSEVMDTAGASHGALAEFLAGINVDVVICGGVGAPMAQKLVDANMQVCPGVGGNCDDAVKSFIDGSLQVNASAVHSGCHHNH